MLSPSSVCCVTAPQRFSINHIHIFWFMHDFLKILPCVEGNGIGNIEGFVLSHFDLASELSEGVCSLYAEFNIARTSLKKPNTTKTSFTILLLVRQRGVYNIIRKQGVKVLNGGQKTRRQLKISVPTLSEPCQPTT